MRIYTLVMCSTVPIFKTNFIWTNSISIRYNARGIDLNLSKTINLNLHHHKEMNYEEYA